MSDVGSGYPHCEGWTVGRRATSEKLRSLSRQAAAGCQQTSAAPSASLEGSRGVPTSLVDVLGVVQVSAVSQWSKQPSHSPPSLQGGVGCHRPAGSTIGASPRVGTFWRLAARSHAGRTPSLGETSTASL